MRRASPETLRKLTVHGRRVQVAKVRLKQLQAARNEAIQTAIQAGDGVERELAAASGVSRSRVSQLRRALNGGR